jgi:hypothetical protein
LPSFERRPWRDNGIPVDREILRLAAVTPNARFQENVRPGKSFMTFTSPYQSSLPVLGGETPGGSLSVEPTPFSMAARCPRCQTKQRQLTNALQ